MKIEGLEKPSNETGRINATQSFYEREAEEREKRDAEDNKEEEKALSQEKKAEEADSGKPSYLKNNPFYFGPEGQASDSSGDFNSQKTVITSRLVQFGIAPDTARSIVAESSSPEEIVMHLMHDENISYGEATDMVNIGRQ